jgi:hypothetical protein
VHEEHFVAPGRKISPNRNENQSMLPEALGRHLVPGSWNSQRGYHEHLHPIEATGAEVSALVERVTETAGGPASLRVILLLAGVLALQSADTGSIGALASQIETAFDIGNTRSDCSSLSRRWLAQGWPYRRARWQTGLSA